MADLLIGPARHRWEEALHVLQHSLGLDEHGQGKAYRNHYVASPGGHTWDVLMHHVASGRMVRHDPREIFGGDDCYCFVVTDAGKEYVREHSPKPPKLTRAQRRYRMFLRADSSLSFIEWLKYDCKRTEEWMATHG